MARSSLKSVIASLAGLTAEERAEVVRWCDAMGVQSLAGKPSTEAVEHVYGELASLLAQTYRSPQQSLINFIRYHTATYRKLLRCSETVDKAAHAWWPDVRRNEHLALVRLLCRVAFDESMKRHRRVGWAQLIGALAEIEATVNAAFPGWLSNGLFQQHAIRRVTHARHESAAQAAIG